MHVDAISCGCGEYNACTRVTLLSTGNQWGAVWEVRPVQDVWWMALPSWAKNSRKHLLAILWVLSTLEYFQFHFCKSFCPDTIALHGFPQKNTTTCAHLSSCSLITGFYPLWTYFFVPLCGTNTGQVRDEINQNMTTCLTLHPIISQTKWNS